MVAIERRLQLFLLPQRIAAQRPGRGMRALLEKCEIRLLNRFGKFVLLEIHLAQPHV